MTGQWPPAELPGLHIDMRARPPTADYRCGRCPYTDAASGDGAAIAALAERAAAHRTTCRSRPETTPQRDERP